MSPHEIALRRLLYEIPGMESVEVREEDVNDLPIRIYGKPGPAVVIVEGYPDAGFEKHVGCKFMDMQWTISMAQLLAASGFRVVTHSNRDPLPDAIALLEHFGPRVGIWATSGHAAVAMQALGHATCGVFTNPVVGDSVPERPMFIVRSGRDETPDLNNKLGRFIDRAIQANASLTLVNIPDAPHSFELNVPGPVTAVVLEQAIAFLRAALAVP